MDPNANWEEQQYLKAEIKKGGPDTRENRSRLRELQVAMRGWLARGGFPPSKGKRSANPRGAKARKPARSSNPHDGDRAERLAWEKKLYAGKKSFPCPTCVRRGERQPSMLTAKQKAMGHQCDCCADRDEGRFGNPVKKTKGPSSTTWKFVKKLQEVAISHGAKHLEVRPAVPSLDMPSRTVLSMQTKYGLLEYLDIYAGHAGNGTVVVHSRFSEDSTPAAMKAGLVSGNGKWNHYLKAGSPESRASALREFQRLMLSIDRSTPRKENPASKIKLPPKTPKYFTITSVAKAKRKANPAMTGVQFRDLLLSLADVRDRLLLVKATEKTVSEGNIMSLRSTDSVYVNLINLPKEYGGAGGGAEAENNRWLFSVSGFDGRGTVKVEEVMSPVRMPRLRAKTGTPDKIAKYLADYLAKVVATVEPNFTHGRRPNPVQPKSRVVGKAKGKSKSKSQFGVLPPSDRRYVIRNEFTQEGGRIPQYVVRFNGKFVGSAFEHRDAVKIQQRHAAGRLAQLRVLPVDHSAGPRQSVASAEFSSGDLPSFNGSPVLLARCCFLNGSLDGGVERDGESAGGERS